MNRIVPCSSCLLLLVLGCAGAPAPDAPYTEGPSSGAEIYKLQCTLCHGADGRLGLSGAKDLTVSVLGTEEMVKLVMDGRGGMMPYKNVLTPAEIDSVVDHVRTLRRSE